MQAVAEAAKALAHGRASPPPLTGCVPTSLRPLAIEARHDGQDLGNVLQRNARGRRKQAQTGTLVPIHIHTLPMAAQSDLVRAADLPRSTDERQHAASDRNDPADTACDPAHGDASSAVSPLSKVVDIPQLFGTVAAARVWRFRLPVPDLLNARAVWPTNGCGEARSLDGLANDRTGSS